MIACADLQKKGITGSVLVNKLLPKEEWNVFCSLGKGRSAGSLVGVRRTSDQVWCVVCGMWCVVYIPRNSAVLYPIGMYPPTNESNGLNVFVR